MKERQEEDGGMRLCELRQKEVINVCDCKIIGCVCDVEINAERGCVEALIVPGPARICGFLGRDTEYVIPWECVKQVGDDIILVRVDLEKVSGKCKY